MTSWGAVRAHLERQRRVVAGGDAWRGLLVDAVDARGRVVLKHATGEGSHLIVAALVCAADRIPFEHALRYNGAAAHGMLMLEGSAYALRQLVRLDSVTLDDIDRLVEAMAAEAAALRAEVVFTAPPVDPVGGPFSFVAE